MVGFAYACVQTHRDCRIDQQSLRQNFAVDSNRLHLAFVFPLYTRSFNQQPNGTVITGPKRNLQ